MSTTSSKGDMVYPRAYGGTQYGVRRYGKAIGLSPCVRGNQNGDTDGALGAGSIPVRTGEPRPQALAAAPRTVYPRAYGGTYASNPGGPAHDGLSPCVRGNRHQRRAEGDDGRSIPVRTGEPAAWLGWKKWTTVYPRAYGGTARPHHVFGAIEGLSPCVRGNRSRGSYSFNGPRSIPVRTGEPSDLPARPEHDQVYPRAYGGTSHRYLRYRVG